MLHIAERNLVFLHIPKNAGKAVRLSLMEAATISYAAIAQDLQINEADAEEVMDSEINLPGIGLVMPEHLPLAILKSHFPLSFAVLRNSRSFVLARAPRDRFFSALMQRLGEYKDIKSMRADDPRVLHEAQLVCERLARSGKSLELEYAHFERQVDFTDLDGERVVSAVFPMERFDAAARWIETETGLHIQVVHDHVRREPKKWSRSIQPAARFVGRNLIPHPIKRIIYPLWMNSGVFANAAERYKTIELADDVESFIAEYYAPDAALYQEACDAADRIGKVN